MKRLVVCVLVFMVLSCSVVYGYSYVYRYLHAENELDLHYRETCLRHDREDYYCEYRLVVAEYKDLLLTEYGY